MTSSSVIESILQHKENILPLDHGRSASKLSLTLKHSNSHLIHKDRLQAERAFHERQLLEWEDSDDPLQLYLDYISWTHNSFPSGPSADSGLVPLLERCTSTFRDTPLYKNDPRYLSTWLLYSQYSDSPKDIFVYLAKKKIGLALALYYERFATYLESSDNVEDAKHVYITGIEQEAFPLARLRKSFQKFCARLENHQPSSERIPPTLHQGSIPDLSVSHDLRPTKKAKFACHVDTEPTPSSSIFADPVRSPVALADRSTRIKENVMAASTWAGAIIEPRIPLSRADSSLKFSVFRDDSLKRPLDVAGGPSSAATATASVPSDVLGRSYTIVDQGKEFVSLVTVPGKRPEQVEINMDLLYNDNLCPLELLLIRKKIHSINNIGNLHQKMSIVPESIDRLVGIDLAEPNEKSRPFLSRNLHSHRAALPSQCPIDSRPTQSLYNHSPQAIASSLNTHELPLRLLLAPSRAPVSARAVSAMPSSSEQMTPVPFNARPPPNPSLNNMDSAPQSSSRSVSPQPPTNEADPVSQFSNEEKLEPPLTDKNLFPIPFSLHNHLNEQTSTTLTHDLEPLPYNHEGMCSPTMTGFSRAANQEVYAIFNSAACEIKSTRDDFKMEDDPTITNYDGFVTETIHLPPQSLQPAQTPPTDTEVPECSSPFVELPRGPRSAAIDPRDPQLQAHQLQNLAPPLSTFPGYYDMSRRKIARANKFQAITDHKTMSISKGSRLAMIDFCGDGLFCLRHQLGKGGYGTVYLTELESCGSLGALKIESPAARWEFYILRQIQSRLESSHPTSRAFVVIPHSLYFFQDESYLFMDYCSQGNLLDLVNLHKSNAKLVDEALCVHLTIELLKATQLLHQNGIIHGDLKADNCMLRFEPCLIDDQYSTDPDSPWRKKSITLIDFGKSIDLHLFEKNVSLLDEKGVAVLGNFDADFIGLADTLHTLLFGEYLKTSVTNGVRSLTRQFKRYWLAELWTPLFDFLLNPLVGSTLDSHRLVFEKWLKENSRTKKLKDVVASIERDLTLKRIK